MSIQRTIIGVLGLCSLLSGMYLAVTNQATTLNGILVRVGLMLCVTWLALPSLLSSENQRSLKIGMLLVSVLVLVAMRPRVLIVALAIALIVWVVNLGLKRITQPNRQ